MSASFSFYLLPKYFRRSIYTDIFYEQVSVRVKLRYLIFLNEIILNQRQCLKYDLDLVAECVKV